MDASFYMCMCQLDKCIARWLGSSKGRRKSAQINCDLAWDIANDGSNND